MHEEFTYFFLEKDKSFRILGYDEGEITPLRKNGNELIDLPKNELMEFFRDKTGHFDEKVDLVYISDSFDESLFDELHLTKDTYFNRGLVKKMIKKIEGDKTLVTINGDEIQFNGLVYKSNHKFVSLDEMDICESDLSEKKKEIIIEELIDASQMARYYVEKTAQN